MNWKLLMLAVLCVGYLYRMLLVYARLRSDRNEIPENVRDLYDAESFAKWKSYNRETCRLDFVSETVRFALDLVLLTSGVYAALVALLPTGSTLWRSLAVVLLYVLSDALLVPVEWVRTMKLEQKYGFNRSTAKTFFLDQLKNMLLSLALLVLMTKLLELLHPWLGDKMVLAFAVILPLLMFGIAYLVPIFSKLSNKFTPLPEGELRTKLTDLLTKNGYRVSEIKVMDASRRSTKLNAYFTGFGRLKTIVLFDTLVEKLSPDDICAVFAHELGHGLHKDTLRLQLLNCLYLVGCAVLMWLNVRTPEIGSAFGFTELNYGFAVVLAFCTELALWSPVCSLVMNAAARHAEYRADEQAVKEGFGEALIHSLRVLTKENMNGVAPSAITVLLEYNHPTLSQRIASIEEKIKKYEKS